MIIEKIPYKLLSVVFLLLSGVPIYFISTLSKGNFLAGPISIILCIPLIITQGVIIWFIWNNQIKFKQNLILSAVSFLILCFEMYLLYKYITKIT